MGDAFAMVADEASPAVVGIRAEWTIEQPVAQMPGLPQDFFEFFFRRRMPQQQQPPQQQRRRRAQGSGFIISDDGYILTNSHVVHEAESVRVDLRNGETVDAEVIGTDPESDVAVIRVNSGNLPTLKLADSDALKVGEWVLAIGNPLGLSHTVTAGIVSAKGRSGLRIASYENFIQTDAAINMGNSGGPLIDLQGRAVGMNTAIVGPGGGNIGIGFAIPMNMAKDISDQLIETGSVERGYLGVVPQEVTPEMAEAFGMDEPHGVAIPQVTEDSAADKAGLRRNDVIVEFDGKPVKSETQFRNRVAETKPGEKAEVVVLRNGRRRTLTVTLARRPSVEEMRGQQQREQPSGGARRLGLAVQNLTSDLAEQFGYKDVSGVIVARVAAGSEAAEKGIRPGYLIEQVNQQEVANVEQFEQAVKKSRDKGRVLLLVSTPQTSQYVTLKLNDN
jgi:serine protease Do